MRMISEGTWIISIGIRQKHRLVKCVKDWPYSGFHRFVKNGSYPHDWGGDGIDMMDESGFGE